MRLAGQSFNLSALFRVASRTLKALVFPTHVEQ